MAMNEKSEPAEISRVSPGNLLARRDVWSGLGGLIIVICGLVTKNYVGFVGVGILLGVGWRLYRARGRQ